jgi:hypothetical protein
LLSSNKLPKADADDFIGRFREIILDPLNIAIHRHPHSGYLIEGRTVLHNGLSVPAKGEGSYYSDFSAILLINRGVHEPLEEFVFQQILAQLRPNPVMLELGAYWGHYSMWLKNSHPAANVIMVEPDETNLRAGIENFKFNNLNGKFINSFVAKDRFEVDTFLQNENIDRLDILHSDVQGYEIEMLDGCKMTLSEKRTDYLFISTHSQALHEEALEKVASFGYRIEISSNSEGETTSCDGFIFASSPNIPQALDSFVPLTREQLTNAKPNEIFDYLAQIRTQVKHTR